MRAPNTAVVVQLTSMLGRKVNLMIGSARLEIGESCDFPPTRTTATCTLHDVQAVAQLDGREKPPAASYRFHVAVIALNGARTEVNLPAQLTAGELVCVRMERMPYGGAFQ